MNWFSTTTNLNFSIKILAMTQVYFYKNFFLPFCIGIFCLALPSHLFAQGTQFKWISGDSTSNQSGNFGQKGISSISNSIKGLHSFTSQVDENDNLLLFGGIGFGSGSSSSYCNDLWRWNGSTWTWLSGDSSINGAGNYGSKGITSASNLPPSRAASSSWLASNGDFWLFGGFANDGLLSDLWKWDGSNWTWVAGDSTLDQSPSYGIKGQASSSNHPGARRQAAYWSDNNGDFWLFGGQNSAGNFGDLWKWDGSNWTWVAGDSVQNSMGIYGTMGQAGTQNKPGSRFLSFGWADDNDVFWLFAGFGNAESQSGVLNDLWKYDAGNWTWISGSKNPNSTGKYGIQNLEDSENSPKARAGFAAWTDSLNHFHVYGGINLSGFGTLSDLWSWNGRNWTWEAGDSIINSAPVYGTKGLSHPDNRIGYYNEGAAHYFSDGTILYFGGRNFFNLDFSNTLWEIIPKNLWDGNSWSHGQAPNSSQDAFIRDSINPGNIQCRNLILENSSQLNLGSNSIEINGDLINNGVLSNGDGKLIFNGSGHQNILGKHLKFSGDIHVEAGTTLISNDSLTLSAISDTVFAQLLLRGNLQGKLNIQTWLPLDTAEFNGRYFHLASPMVGTLLSDFSDGGIIQTGQTNNSQNSIWEWDATQSIWISPDSLNQEIPIGKGRVIYAGKNIYGNFLIADGGAKALSFTSDSLLNSDVTLSLDYHNGQGVAASFAGSGTVQETQGWNLIANPYSCHYNWDSLVEFGLANGISSSIYTWNGQSYSVYSPGGISLNGGSALIPPFQAFFVQNNSGGSQNLTIKEQFRVLGENKALSKKANSKDGLKIIIQKANHQGYDEIWIGFEKNHHPGFDPNKDAWKLFGDSKLPQLYSSHQQKKFAVNIHSPDSTSQSIFLGVSAPNDHLKSLKLKFLLDDLKSYSSLWLLDKKTQQYQDLLRNDARQFIHDSSFAEQRFQLVFQRPTVSDKESNVDDNFYFYEKQGMLYLRKEKAWNKTELRLFTIDGKLIKEIKMSNSTQELINRREGVFYALEMTCEGEGKTIIIH